MSKRTAKRWAEIAPMKDSTVQKIDLNKIVTEKSFIMNEADNGKTLMKVVSQVNYIIFDIKPGARS